MEIYYFDVDETDCDVRLDVFISNKIKMFSRSYIKKIIDDDAVSVNNTVKKPNYRLKIGDKIKVIVPEPVEAKIEAQNIDIDVVYEDEHILIVNKPQGMVVHPAHGNKDGTLVNALLKHCTSLSGIGGVKRPGIVHRIDKDTSGLIIVAKTDEAHIELSKQLKERSIIRKYIALIEGRMKAEKGTINAPIGRHPNDRKKMAVVDKNGRNAVTYYKVIERFNSNTLIEAQLETGRTHQIRVHMSYLGYPITGDTLYGYKRQKISSKGQFLHAYILEFYHPVTGEYLKFRINLPDYFDDILKKLRQAL
jgi:23S rRNA pseudouridine1911/1915/1917 synthase